MRQSQIVAEKAGVQFIPEHGCDAGMRLKRLKKRGPAPESQFSWLYWLEPSAAMGGLSSMEERPIHETATEARQAVKVGAMRYVLGVGIAGAGMGLLLAWLFFGS